MKFAIILFLEMWLRKLFMNWPYVELFFNIVIPSIGIFFYSWGVGNVFWMFFLELLLIGGFTCIKILFATKNGSFLGRFGRMLGFILGFCVLFILIAVLAGNFGVGEAGAFNANISRTTFYLVIGNYVFGFVVGFMWSGKYRRTDYKKLSGDTLRRITGLFFMLLLILLPFSFMVNNPNINYIMGMAIVITKNAVDYYLGQRKELKDTEG